MGQDATDVMNSLIDIHFAPSNQYGIISLRDLFNLGYHELHQQNAPSLLRLNCRHIYRVVAGGVVTVVGMEPDINVVLKRRNECIATITFDDIYDFCKEMYESNIRDKESLILWVSMWSL